MTDKRTIKVRDAFLKFPLISKLFNDFENDIQNFGIYEAYQRLINKYRTRFKVVMADKTRKILYENPVVIAANHPYEIETFALMAALPNRNDIKTIVSKNILGIIPELDNRLIPVDIEHHAASEKGGKLSGKLIKWIGRIPQDSYVDAHAFNIQSIKKASKHVNKGGIVAIYPAGFRGKKGRWFSGVGHLVKDINARNAYYIMAYIKGTSNFDYLRLFQSFGILLPIITVYFSEPQPIFQVKNKSSEGKEIAFRLESLYDTWIKNL